MTNEQNALYWRLWSEAAVKLREQGYARDDVEAMRKRIHFRAGAYWLKYGKLMVKSASHLDNRDFDQVKAIFLSISRAHDLKAQLDQLEMPAKRILHAARELLDDLQIDADPDTRKDYLAGVARKKLEDCDDEDLQRIIISLTHTRAHKLGKDHNHPKVGKGPKSKYAHDVGARSRKSAAQPQHANRASHANRAEQIHLGI